MRSGTCLATAAGAILAFQVGCASRQALPPVAPARLSAAGDTLRFGPGIVGLSADGRHVDLRLSAPAFVLFYNEHPDGWAELLSSARLSNGEREFVIPLATGPAGAGAARVPFTVTCSGTGRTATEAAAAAQRCADLRAAGDDRTQATMVAGRSPRAGYRDVLVVVVWDRSEDDPQLLARDYRSPRIFDPARPAEVLPPAVLTRAVRWAAWAIAP